MKRQTKRMSYSSTVNLAKMAVKYLAEQGKKYPGKWISCKSIGDAIHEPSKDSVRYALNEAQSVMPQIEAARGHGFRYVWPTTANLYLKGETE